MKQKPAAPEYHQPGLPQLGFDWGLIERQDLPESMQDIVDTIGLEGVRFLTEHFGGGSLHVRKLPTRMRTVAELDRHHFHGWMQELIGLHSLALARRLVSAVGGEMLYVPVAREIEERAIARRIRLEYDGTNAARLAARYRMPYRRVIQIGLGRDSEARRKRSEAA